MNIRVRGACENNLKNLDVDIGDGLTVVTGVSGSGKTSLVFDTIYREARRRLDDVFNSGRSYIPMSPAKVDSVTGIGPTIAVGQNLLNRNPISSVASASGLHPFLRLLFSRFGDRFCPECGTALHVASDDEIVEGIHQLVGSADVELHAPIMHGSTGSHRTLLSLLKKQFPPEDLRVDGRPWKGRALRPDAPHSVSVVIGRPTLRTTASSLRASVQQAKALGSTAIVLHRNDEETCFSTSNSCPSCGTWVQGVESKHFAMKCPECAGKGCKACADTGIHPLAAHVRWEGLNLTQLMDLTVESAYSLFSESSMPSTADRLLLEIKRRLEALLNVGLGYVQLGRPSPTLSRGESQRVRIAVSLTSRLEDVVHVLDEPTIGQHPADTKKLLPFLRNLRGPVIFVEHDRLAASVADRAIDIGPGAGEDGGRVVFTGTPAQLWRTETATGRYFSRRDRVSTGEDRPEPRDFLTVRKASKHNLRGIDVKIPVGRFCVISGVSGSGKSTLVEHVIVPTLEKRKPVGCDGIDGKLMKPLLVDQKPIGMNPRSNPATYTKLSDIVRDLYAQETGLSSSHFSFNRPEGACPSCKGMGAVEVAMLYLPSVWITCSECEGKRYSEETLAARVRFGDRELSIADLYDLSILDVRRLLYEDERLPAGKRKSMNNILDALITIGLGYLRLGQASPSLSGGEAQRVKLAKFLGRKSLNDRLIVLDEPSTGLHPKDLEGLLGVLYQLVRAGATILVVEHNTDIIRAADWVIELGPGAGPEGGQLVYSGRPEGLVALAGSPTGEALRGESRLRPLGSNHHGRLRPPKSIAIRDATANNLKHVSVEIPKSKLVVVTGVSGSGKSSLVRDVLEAEARRRYLETLSMYERQGLKEGPEAPVENISGLGVTMSVDPGSIIGGHHWDSYRVRTTVGTVSELSIYLMALFASIGKRRCLQCGADMVRGNEWKCPTCGTTRPLDRPRDFSSRTYTSACETCHGIGYYQAPVPEKLITDPSKPLCAGAMHSPGFFPQGYLCQRYNGGYYVIRALAAKFGFDPMTTPWDRMSKEAQDAFLFGTDEPLEVLAESRSRPDSKQKPRQVRFRGFYGGWGQDFDKVDTGAWGIGTWDVGGMFTRRETCKKCGGAGLRPDFLTVTVGGHNIHELNHMDMEHLAGVLQSVAVGKEESSLASDALTKMLKRLRFLQDVGLGYLHLSRVAGSLSAGEAQRILLARLLGSGLTSLTVLIDEPTRGMHPCEVEALIGALAELRDDGNSVVVVEHDPLFIRAADHIVDMGPGPGAQGGKVVAAGSPQDIAQSDTITGKWLRGERRADVDRQRRAPVSWMTIKGACENNLREPDVMIPLGVLVGVCGVSGSGKSTLLIDTVGRALAPKKITTSVAYVPIDPGRHEAILGAPERAVVLDQGREGLHTPGHALDLLRPLRRLYAESEDAHELGLDETQLSRPCSACNGEGRVRLEMGFLPDVYSPCDTCGGTGYSSEAWDVRIKGYSLPELNSLTLDRIYELFEEEETVSTKLRAALDVGLGYLVLQQPSISMSGGEIQRLKIAQELSKKAIGGTLYILDEPTVGQHLEDVNRLIAVLHRLVDEGNSVVVIEHHPHVLSSCDWLIELGPRGGPEGGKVIATGTPENVAAQKTPTSQYIKQTLEGKI